MDRWDALTGVGLVIVAGAVYLVVDLPGLLGYVGVLFVMAGYMGARARAGRS